MVSMRMTKLPEFPPGRPDAMRDLLARHLYGPVPQPPDTLAVSRSPLTGEGAERVRLEMTVGPRHFAVEAALWLPAERAGPVPLICGLDFVGPAGVLDGTGFALDPAARVYSREEYGASGGRLSETLRGTSAYRWPVGMLTGAGFGVLMSCYGSWVPDDPVAWRDHGLCPLLNIRSHETGALSLWAWAMMRMIDAAEVWPEIDAGRIAVAGHSRLGKAALWAAAHDERMRAVLANNSGCGGAAPARHKVGETLAQMAERFPHWTVPNPQVATPEALPFDQHFLLALIAPRILYVASAAEDLWADPEGTRAALAAAQAGRSDWPVGHHIRPGGHDLLPYDWTRYLAFLQASAF